MSERVQLVPKLASLDTTQLERIKRYQAGRWTPENRMSFARALREVVDAGLSTIEREAHITTDPRHETRGEER